MATLDHLILKVNDLDASLRFYTEVLGFSDAGRDGPFTIVKVGPWARPAARMRAKMASNSGPGSEVGARGAGPTLYFNDPNQHLIEIRAYPNVD